MNSDPLADLLGRKTFVYMPDEPDGFIPSTILVSTAVVGKISYIRVLIPEIGFSFSLPWFPMHEYLRMLGHRVEDESEANRE